MKKKCLIIDKMHLSIIPLLQNAGFEVDYLPEIRKEDIYVKISDYFCLIVRSKVYIDEQLLENAKQLKYIARAGAGIDNLSLEAVNKRGIRVVNAPEGNRDALAEHAVGILLSMLNKVIKADREVRNYTWDREGNRGVELQGKTVGLIGYGYMGQAFAKRLAAFGCKIIAYDKYRSGFSDHVCLEVTMEEIYRSTDILSVHIPLTEETAGIVDEVYLAKFEKPIYLLNTARGGILKLDALRKGLEENKVLGAALDVLENEKLNSLTNVQRETFEYLIQSTKTIITPHVAGWTYESYEKINQVLVEKLKKEISIN